MKISALIIFLICLHGAYSFGQNYTQIQTQLEQIGEADQKHRMSIPAVSKKYGPDSKEMKALWKKIAAQDSIHTIAVAQILDTYGWMGKDKIGTKANTALFLVIQHADQKTQEKYLPMMRKAVAERNAEASALALLEDRVALRQGKKQIYGSQINQDTITGKFYVAPLEDPENVDKRRAAVGLQPLSEYVKYWDIVWEPKAGDAPVKKEDSSRQRNFLACEAETEFERIELPHPDFEFSPYYLSNNKLAGFTLTINPANVDAYQISCMNGKTVGKDDYRFDKQSSVFLIKVDGAKSEEQLYPSTLVINGKGYYFYSRFKWYNYKKL